MTETTVTATNPDRKCHLCGATSGIRLLPYNPLTLDPRQWECADGCAPAETAQTERFPHRPQSAANLAYALRAIADKLAALGDYPLPNVWVSIDIQPRGGEDVEVEAVNAIGGALYGKPGETRRVGGGYHHGAYGHVAGVSIDAYTAVTSGAEREMREEIERLRAQLAASGTEAKS